MSKVGTRNPISGVSKQHYMAHSNPFDSDSDGEAKAKPGKAFSAPPIVGKANLKGSTRDESYGEKRREAQSSGFSGSMNRYKNSSRDDSRALESMSVQELESYAVDKAEDTTQRINGCLKIADEIREGATRTLVTLHEQGDQITRTHHTAASMDYDLSRGEKLLGNLGGMFSRTWKPKKSRQIKGPVIRRDDSFKKRAVHAEQREKLGLSSPKGRASPRTFSSEPVSALEAVEREKLKQDDSLSDLSNVLGQLKEMAIDMGSELERQNKSLDNLYDDVDELHVRVKGANARGRHLIRK